MVFARKREHHNLFMLMNKKREKNLFKLKTFDITISTFYILKFKLSINYSD